MSFSAEVKEELCALGLGSDATLKAQAYGMLLFGRAFSADRICLYTENEKVAHLYAQAIDDLTGVQVPVERSSDKKEGSRFFVVSVPEASQRERVLDCFGHTLKDITLRINRANTEDDDGASAFLRGVFLACGTLADPQKEYHLELAVPFRNLASDLVTVLGEYNLTPKTLVRKGGYVLYFKESEQIEDFLTLIHAINASLSIMNVKIYKDIRNRTNRVTNCDTANISKTVTAAANQVKDILMIQKRRGLSSLPEDLQELATLRLQNQELSLRELGGLLSTPLSRSGVNHRLGRIHELAEELRRTLSESE